MKRRSRLKLVPRRIVTGVAVGVIPVWTLPLTTISCVPTCDPCDPKCVVYTPGNPTCPDAGTPDADSGSK
jgi:hypothetical protein